MTKSVRRNDTKGHSNRPYDHCDRPYKGPVRNEELGEIGEQHAGAMLQLVLRGHVSRLQGQADHGLDLAFTGRLPCPEKHLLHFVAQVKTGQSYIDRFKECKAIKMNRSNAKRLLEWRKLEAPVLFLWVDNLTNNIYWRIISKEGKAKSVFLSERDILSPLTPFDIVIRLNRKRKVLNERLHISPLFPPTKGSLKDLAKNYYEQHLLRKFVKNPTLGDVCFTWRGWRHLVRKRRTIASTMQSLVLLPAAKKVLADPDGICGFRRLDKTTRGRWKTESRLIAFERNNVEIDGRTPAKIVAVVRERIIYPSNWRQSFDFDRRMIRDLIFESVYEKVGK